MDENENKRATITSRLMHVLNRELDKQENKHLLQHHVVRPAWDCIQKQIKPYLLIALAMLVVIATTNAYLIWKLT